MDDLISRQAAIDAECEACQIAPKKERGHNCTYYVHGCKEIECLRALPSAQRWIPVTERLPESRAWVLCKCRAKIYEVLSWRGGEWYHDPQHRYMSGFVTYWMPLPGPPREEE